MNRAWRPIRTVLGGLALVVVVAGAASAQLQGLLGSYYNYGGAYLEDFTFSDPGYTHEFDRVDWQVAFGYNEEHYEENNDNGLGFDWEPLGPDAGAFGVLWDGYLTIPEGKELYIGTESDDGSFVFINDQMVVDNGDQHYPWFSWSDNVLAEGTYRIEVFLFCNDLTPPEDKSGIDLWWSETPGIDDTSGWIPGDYLEPVPEPGTFALFLGGLGLSAIVARRRRRLG